MTEWYYGKDGQQHGPIDEAALRAREARGDLGPDDLVWCEGMENWRPYREVLGANSPPPLEQERSAAAAEGEGSVPPAVFGSPYAPPKAGGVPSQAPPGGPGNNSFAVVSLICGILSLTFFCLCGGIFLGIPAVIFGHLSLNQLNAVDNRERGRGMAVAGLVCGYCGLAITLFFMLTGDTQVQFDGVGP
jgi:hypothetical protein